MLTFDMDISFDGMCVSIYLMLHNFLLVIGIINLLVIVKCVQINRTLTLVIIFISSNRPTNPVRQKANLVRLGTRLTGYIKKLKKKKEKKIRESHLQAISRPETSILNINFNGISFSLHLFFSFLLYINTTFTILYNY